LLTRGEGKVPVRVIVFAAHALKRHVSRVKPGLMNTCLEKTEPCCCFDFVIRDPTSALFVTGCYKL
jgi:hypothetical protein